MVFSLRSNVAHQPRAGLLVRFDFKPDGAVGWMRLLGRSRITATFFCIRAAFYNSMTTVFFKTLLTVGANGAIPNQIPSIRQIV